MKKQLLIAAVAASMTSVAMADISISGAAKFNSVDGVYTHEADLFISGKSGDTSVSANLAMDGTAIAIEDLYVATSVVGVAVKMGGWRSGKSELGQTSTTKERVNVSTTFGGLSLAYEDVNGSGNSTTIGGSLAGISVSHKIEQSTATETKASGSIGGVSVAAHSKEDSTSKTNTAVTLTTEVQGVTLTYLTLSNDASVASDGFMGKQTVAAGTDAQAFGIKTSIAGNTVHFKAITNGSTDTNKVIVTRALGAGATFEATYEDKDGVDATLDLELAVSF
jgi:hypothetical protein